jgi:hypothetical protein
MEPLRGAVTTLNHRSWPQSTSRGQRDGATRAGRRGVAPRSPFATARAVVGWCRAAAVRSPGDLLGAVDAALTARGRPPAGDPATLSPLVLPAAPPDRAPLRDRLVPLVGRQTAPDEEGRCGAIHAG